MGRWVVALVMLAPGLAFGQSAQGNAARKPTSAQEFAAVMEDPGHRQDVMANALATPAWQAVACATASYAEAPEISVYLPVKFDAAGAPVSGEWREGVVATGCGRRMQLNVLTEVTAPSTLASGALLPGATITDPEVQNLAQAYAVRAAGGLPAGCKTAYVQNTAFLGFAGGVTAMPQGEITAPWQEDWILYFCGALKVVRLQFTPGVEGMEVGVVSVR